MTKKERVLRAFMLFICIVCVFFSLAEPQTVSEATLAALSLCAERIVPSLFLFTVSSKLFIKCGGTRIFSRISRGFFEKIFHISSGGSAALLLGMISGYPMGAMVLAELLSRGEIEKSEAESILPFITLASPAFLIGSVGNSMFGSKEYGVILLYSQLISSLLLLFFTRGARSKARAFCKTEQEKIAPLTAISDSIKESGAAVLTVCSFVTFFCVFTNILLEFLPISGALGALFGGMIEISGGFFALSKSGADILTRYFYGGAMLGFSGLSVLMQTANAVCADGRTVKKYFKGKAAQAVICAVVAVLLGSFFEKGIMLAVFGLFGNDGEKWLDRIEFGTIFAFVIAVTAVFAALGAKILSFFSKKQENFQKTVEKKR